jgi:hypothetical protein
MTDTQPTPIFSRLLAVVIAVSCLAGTLSVSHAADSFYVVRDIAVDETASSATAARTIAVRNGQKRAFDALLRRLVPEPYYNSLPQLNDAAITPMVASFQVSNERTSAKRYLADLTYEFKRDDIRSLLRANMLPFSESFGKPILVLPVFIAEDRAYLWDYPNPWRTVWIDIIDYGLRPQKPDSLRDDWAQAFLRPVVIPAGSLEDMKAINANQAMEMDAAALEQLRKDYGAAEVEIISASQRTDADGTLLLDVTRNVLGQTEPAAVQTYKGSEDQEELMQSVIFDLLGRMQEEWKQKNVLDFSVENTLAVTTTISSLPDWLALQDKVQGLSAVNGTKVKDITVERVFWYITFVGSTDRLIAALDQRDLALTDRGGYWTLDQE